MISAPFLETPLFTSAPLPRLLPHPHLLTCLPFPNQLTGSINTSPVSMLPGQFLHLFSL